MSTFFPARLCGDKRENTRMKWLHFGGNKTEMTPAVSLQKVILSLSPPQVARAELVES